MNKDIQALREEFIKEFRLKVIPYDKEDVLKSFLLQKQTDHWWNEIMADPVADWWIDKLDKLTKESYDKGYYDGKLSITTQKSL